MHWSAEAHADITGADASRPLASEYTSGNRAMDDSDRAHSLHTHFWCGGGGSFPRTAALPLGCRGGQIDTLISIQVTCLDSLCVGAAAFGRTAAVTHQRHTSLLELPLCLGDGVCAHVLYD